MTPERRQEIKAATKETPVRLTPEEEAEMREEQPNDLRMGVGAGRLLIKVKPGSRGEEILQMAEKGYSIAAIAKELDVDARGVARVLERVYA